MHVRPAQAEDRNRLLEVWERSVRATHYFLTNADVLALRPLVAQELASDALEWWVLATDHDGLIGFLGYSTGTIEALFLDPDYHGQGGGRALVAHAQRLAGETSLSVDVNEQNEGAVAFYKAVGFSVVGRSPTDAGGRPFPILHMRRSSPSAQGAVLQVRIEHVAIWVADLEPMRAFYTEALGGTAGELYENPTTGFRSYFISFGSGPRLELMYRPGLRRQPDSAAGGYAHMALALGSRAAVDAAVVALRERGVPIESEPRVTGDGYYEAIVLDPEHNPVELTV
jgi:catechol 2,3-dioxygenase-like lactoylglutathione lyase family enzyme/GNAT superfamily N-acetyltransferase